MTSPAAAEAAAVAAPGPGGRALVFRCGGERFAMDVAFVREVLPARAVTPVPFVPGSVAGVVNQRGAIYALVDFASLAGLRAGPAAQVLLLRLPEMAVGIAVEEVEGIQASGEVSAASPGVSAGTFAAPFLRRGVDAEGRPLHAVDAEALIDTIYQLPDRSRSGEA